MYELTIIGGGPAGVAAGVYASRKQLSTLFITKDWGGQSTVSVDIQNWIGTPSISGPDLAKNLKDHLYAYTKECITIKGGSLVAKITKLDKGFEITLDNGETYTSQTVLIATGSTRRQLPAKNADIFEHKGLTYCASCDGPLFSGQDVAVIGGGNAAFESAAQLLAYTKSVTIIQRSDTFRADPVTVDKVLSHPNMKSLTNTGVLEVTGEKFVSGLKLQNNATQEIFDLPVGGVFVEIGLIPNTDYLNDVVELDQSGRVIIDPWTQQTKTPGIWAAGDCTNILYHQNNIAAGDAVRALEDIYVNVRAK